MVLKSAIMYHNWIFPSSQKVLLGGAGSAIRGTRSTCRRWEGTRQDVCSPTSFLPGCLGLTVTLLRPHSLPGSTLPQLLCLVCCESFLPLWLQAPHCFQLRVKLPSLAVFLNLRPMPFPEFFHTPYLTS